MLTVQHQKRKVKQPNFIFICWNGFDQVFVLEKGCIEACGKWRNVA